MSTASMVLLQGTPAEPPPAAAAPGAVKIDVAKLGRAQLDRLLDDYGIEVPPEWSTWKVAQKRAWLEAEFAGGKEVVPVAAEGTAIGGEVLAPDQFSHIIAEIENLTEAEAHALVDELRDTADLSFFRLAGVLSVVKANGWYKADGTFKEYVARHGIAHRTATYWMSIYHMLVDTGVPFAKVQHLGWSKLKELVPVLTAGNAEVWIKTAAEQSTVKLIETVKHAQQQAGAAAGGGASGEVVPGDAGGQVPVHRTFKFYEDQHKTVMAAIAKARQASGTEYDSAALELICLDYLNNGGSQPESKSLFDQMVGLGIEKVLEVLEQAFPAANITVEVPDME